MCCFAADDDEVQEDAQEMSMLLRVTSMEEKSVSV